MNSISKLSVGVVLESDYNPTTGGGFTYYDTLIHHLDKYEFNESLDVFFISIGENETRTFQKKIISISPSSYFNKKDVIRNRLIGLLNKRVFKHFRFARKFRDRLNSSHQVVKNNYVERALVENKVDLLYFLIPGGNLNLNYPFIMTHWDNGHVSMYSFPEVSMNYTFENRQHYYNNMLAKAFAIFCESQAGKKELVRYFSINEDRIGVIPIFPGNVINIELTDDQQTLILNKYDLKTNQFFFYPAQFWSHKNHYNLLLAFEKLVVEYPEVKLVFTGSDKGNLEYIQEVIVRLQLKEKVIIAGFVSYETLFTFYKNCIALVMPTFLGPTNIPLLEAEAIGCHIICSDFDGHREMLSDKAHYIKPDSAPSLFEAMTLCIKSSISKEQYTNQVFNINNSLRQIEINLFNIKSKRKTFGYEFLQF